LPTEFVWRDPSNIPPRPWVYGRHLIRKQVSVTVAPGGVGKSSLTICEALAMASGRELLGDWTAKGLKVWLYNLEDPRDEMDRRIIAAMQHHHVSPEEIAGRLYVDTGRERVSHPGR
jgi:RecA-family ATPase